MVWGRKRHARVGYLFHCLDRGAATKVVPFALRDRCEHPSYGLSLVLPSCHEALSLGASGTTHGLAWKRVQDRERRLPEQDAGAGLMVRPARKDLCAAVWKIRGLVGCAHALPVPAPSATSIVA